MKMRTLFFLLPLTLALLTACNSAPPKDANEQPFTDVVHPAWMKDAIIYEVNIRQFSTEGTFSAFAEHLPRLKELGVDILWLMPVHPIGVKNRKGGLGSYYSVLDYKGVNPEFGTMEDFKAMLSQVHDLGMKLIIDWVPNHSAWDNPLVDLHPDWYAKDSTGKMFSPWDWTDVVQFDYSQRGLRDYMTEAMQFWLTEVGIDGFRQDVAHQVPVDFWNELRPALLEVKPDMMLLAEAENRELHQHAFDASYAWEFHHLMNEVAKGAKTVAVLDSYFERADSTYNEQDIRMYFTSNHDENSWNGTEFERLGDATEVMAVLSYLLPGMPLIYNGQEAGFNRRLLFFEKDSIDWVDHPFNELYHSLNRLKKENQALWNPGFGGTYERINNGQDDKVITFIRQGDDNQIVAVFNLSAMNVTVTLKHKNLKGVYLNYFTGQEMTLQNGTFDLSPWEYQVFVK